MLPIINLGSLHIPSYGLFVLIGALAFTITTIILLEKVEKKQSKVTNSLLIISIFGFIILVASAFIMNSFFHSLKAGQIVFGGITWLGGVIIAFPAMIFLVHKFCFEAKAKPLAYFNFMIPGIVLAHGFGRLGCFLGGCCYGEVTNLFFGISFPEGSLAALEYPSASGGSLPVSPTQLFEACFEFLLFFIMLLSYKKTKNYFFEIYAFSYGIFRFLIEFIRGDDRGAYIIFLSPSQIMSLVLIIYGVLILLYKRGLMFEKIRQKMKEMESEVPFHKGINKTIVQTIRELKKLQKEGILTDEEFEAQKRELLNRLLE